MITAIVTAIPIVSGHCQSVVRQRTVLCPGTVRRARPPLPLHIAQAPQARNRSSLRIYIITVPAATPVPPHRRRWRLVFARSPWKRTEILPGGTCNTS